MKKTSRFLLLALLCLQLNLQAEKIPYLFADTIIQNYHKEDQIKATKTKALIRMKVTDFKQNKLADLPVWVHNNKGQYWHGTTDIKGEVFFLLPNNQKYQTNVDQEVDYRKFSIPKEAKYFKTVKVVLMTSKIKETVSNDTVYQSLPQGIMPTASRALVNIKVKGLDGHPLPNEIILYEGQTHKKVYYTKTDASGKSRLMLPKGDTYCIHSYAFRDIKCKEYELSNTSRTSRFELTTISTSEFIKRKIERARLLAERDSLMRATRIRDSLRLERNEFVNFYLQYRYSKRNFDLIEKKIKTLAGKDQVACESNQHYYAEMGDEIKAMFYRNKDKWPNKRVIANIDCSMYKYIDELMVWNFSDTEEQNNNTYWLFNGFNYEGNEHADESRRGIFPVPQNNVEGFFNTIDKIVNFSCRGSRLENVVEALILGAEGKKSEEDMLFIADNYSDVSDLHKLKDLHVPVHVLLTASRHGINENYLEIAYRTGGSIHTIAEDISANQLKELRDGEQLKVGKFAYTFYKGKFLKVS